MPGDERWAEVVRTLGDRLLALQRRIAILPAIRWPADVKRHFLRHRGRELPRVTRSTYDASPLGFEPNGYDRDLRELQTAIAQALGRNTAAARLLLQRCQASRQTVAMLAARGTRQFAAGARLVFDVASGQETSTIHRLLNRLSAHARPAMQPPQSVTPGQMRDLVTARVQATFPAPVAVALADGMATRAAARGRQIRLNRFARFARGDVEPLVAHECWLHLGSSFNARRQPTCRFLGSAIATATATQEGLAVLCEVLNAGIDLRRIQTLGVRFEAVQLVDCGADFRDVFRHLRDRGLDTESAYDQAARVFRGSLPSGCGPFPRDRCYALGLARILAAAESAMAQQDWHTFLLLLCGKVGIQERPFLAQLVAEGILARPAFVPPPLRDARAIQELLRRIGSFDEIPRPSGDSRATILQAAPSRH